MNRIAVMVGLLALTAAVTAADPAQMMELHSLAEVRTLDALPREVNVLLGRQKNGPDGIADPGKPFNRGDAVDSRLPMRRLIVAGSSLSFVLVAYEQGGRAYSIHAAGFELQPTGWTEVGEWTLTKRPATLYALIHFIFPDRSSRASQVSLTRPERRDGPLRSENITDEEVREIQAVMASLLPGAIVNISGVVTGCPCEEGGGCSDQVWVVAYRPERSRGLQLSRISGHWTVGPLQQWWLDYERLEAQWPTISDRNGLRDYLAAQDKLYERFPSCGKSAALTAH